MNIDWSKAPEGTTHYDLSECESDPNKWMRLEGKCNWSTWQGDEWSAPFDPDDAFIEDVEYERCVPRPIETPKPNTKWEHHSGRIYRVVMIANANTERPNEYPVTVVYENVDNGTVWSRPVSDWDRSFVPYDEKRKEVINTALNALDSKELATCEWSAHAERIIANLYDTGMLKESD